MNKNYVHGYSVRESFRLYDQANTLTDILHYDTTFPAGSLVLEAGCGVGAQTVIISKKNPDSRFISMDISVDSLRNAKELIQNENIKNVEFQAGDIFNMTFADNYFDHIFVCFVLEHLPEPVKALQALIRVLKKGGSITVIEGDHGSCYFHPDSEYAHRAIKCLVDIQVSMKGNALIGRELYPLLVKSGYQNVHISPRMVYVDSSRPGLVDGFTKNTFTAMVEGVKEQALSQNLIDENSWDKGIADLYRTAGPDGVFCYTFFKGVAVK